MILSPEFATSLSPMMPLQTSFESNSTSKPIHDHLDSTTRNNVLHFISVHNDVHPSLVSFVGDVTKFSFLTIEGHKYGSQMDRSDKKTIVFAQWRDEYYGEPLSCIAQLARDHTCNCYLRPFSVQYYIEVLVTIRDEPKSFVLAKGYWPKFSDDYSYFGKPYSVWCDSLVESNMGALSFISLGQIVCNCAYLHTTVSNSNVLCICPLIS